MVNDSELRNQQVGQSGMQTGGDFDDMIMDDNELAEALREEGVPQGEALEARQIPDVPQPSKQERKAHELLHMPYRVWCSDCVKGRGMGTQHRKCTRTEKRGVSQVAMDYFFPAPNLTCGSQGRGQPSCNGIGGTKERRRKYLDCQADQELYR